MNYNEAFIPAPILRIEDPEVLKVLIHPLRSRILGLLGPQARTVKELASELDLAPSHLYYHTKLLLKAGLIVAVGERRLGNLTEASYRVAALDFDASPILGSKESGRSAFEARIASIADLMASSIKASARDMASLLEGAEERPKKEGGGPSLVLRMAEARLGPAAYEDFSRRLMALMDEFSALPLEPEESEGGEIRNYVLNLGFYPQAGSTKAKE